MVHRRSEKTCSWMCLRFVFNSRYDEPRRADLGGKFIGLVGSLRHRSLDGLLILQQIDQNYS